MAYITDAQVISEMPSTTFSATSKVTSSKLAEIIAEHDAMINSALTERYVTPITGTEALLAIRKIALDLAVGRINNILLLTTSPEQTEGGNITTGKYASAMLALKRLREGADVLSDAPKRQSTSGVVSYNEDVTPFIDVGYDKSEDIW